MAWMVVQNLSIGRVEIAKNGATKATTYAEKTE
jgi:hypothetical protein